MAHRILAVEPLSRNDIPILAHLFEVSFDYYLGTNSPFFIDYLKHLRMLAGLGFTAVLVDRDLLLTYQHYLDRFMVHNEGDFRASQNAKTLIAQSAAEMVVTAAISFSALNCPRYYQDFIVALHHTIATIPERGEEQRNAQSILARLAVK